MLLKSADSKDLQIAELERKIRAAHGSHRTKLEDDKRKLKAGIKAEEDAAYLINFDYEKSINWAVIHDLRLEIGGRVAQIDHLLINRFLEVYVLETKSFHSELKITEDGEFLRRIEVENRYVGMASPIAQNERHITVLKDAFREIELPTRLGIRLSPTFQSFVLVSSGAVVTRPEKFDASRVIKADGLKQVIDKQFDTEGILTTIGSMARLIDKGTLYAIGRRIANMHTPLNPIPEPYDGSAVVAQGVSSRSGPLTSAVQAEGSGPLPQATTSKASQTQGPTCKHCGKCEGSIKWGQYGYYFKCLACDGNTSMKWDCGTPGHNPRIRKDGRHFFRECEGCRTSVHFHENPDG